MKTIRSNKKGFGIHSPYVYKLVTNVLFVTSGFYVFDEIEKLNKSNCEKNQLKLLFRLLCHFYPDVIFYDMNLTPEDLNILKKFGSQAVFKKIDKEFFLKANIEITNKNIFFILSELLYFKQWNIPKHGIFFFKNKTNKNNVKHILKPMLEKERGRILIEFSSEDLIIFDKRFLSQHYVIK